MCKRRLNKQLYNFIPVNMLKLKPNFKDPLAKVMVATSPAFSVQPGLCFGKHQFEEVAGSAVARTHVSQPFP